MIEETTYKSNNGVQRNKYDKHNKTANGGFHFSWNSTQFTIFLTVSGV
jgi:hypothetical protein